MILYHKTHWEYAQSILENGFEDGRGYYHTASLHSGVWFYGRPSLGGADGSGFDAELKVTVSLSERDLDQYKWDDPVVGEAEWLIPAEVIKRHGKVELFDRLEEPPWVNQEPQK